MTDFARRGWGFVVATAVLAVVSSVLAKWWLPGTVASGLAAVSAVLGGVWVGRSSSMLQARDARREGLASEVWVSHSRQLPVVKELRDPMALGVHPAASSGPS